MSEINWRDVAEKNGLSPKEFAKEILTVAACVGSMEIDKNDGNPLLFTCSDSVGLIQVRVNRVKV